ncbi:MAG TPA: hypothetical protein VIQ76_08525 [Propionibacteriaceae bacterium]|jgi:hypothetical protein
MTRLARQALVAVYEARFPTAPNWQPGPLPFRHRDIRADMSARSSYYSDQTSRILYGTPEQPRRWHRELHQTDGGTEVIGVEALCVTGETDALGLIAIHLRTTGNPMTTLRSLARRRNAPPPAFDPQGLVEGQAKIDTTRTPSSLALIVPTKRGLPRLYPWPRYRRWPAANQWLWALASRTTLADFPPDPRNLEPTDNDIIRLSVDWHGALLRDGIGFVGLRPDRGENDPFFGYAELYARSIYLDAVLLGLLQKQAIDRLEERLVTVLDGHPPDNRDGRMAELERDVGRFRHLLWRQHLTTHGIPNLILAAYHRQHALRDRFDQILTEIADFNRLARDDENRHVNSATVLFTLTTVPAGIALGVMQVLGSQRPLDFAIATAVVATVTALLLRTRSARMALRALRNRFTQ